MRPMQQVKFLIVVVILGFLSGCAIVNHMDQLLMMGEYSRDKNVQFKMVDEINAHYDALALVVNAGKIKNYPDQTAIMGNFGEPIAKKTIQVEGQSQERWLYRHAIPQKAKDKIYLYFDKQGKLVNHTQEKIEW